MANFGCFWRKRVTVFHSSKFCPGRTCVKIMILVYGLISLFLSFFTLVVSIQTLFTSIPRSRKNKPGFDQDHSDMGDDADDDGDFDTGIRGPNFMWASFAFDGTLYILSGIFLVLAAALRKKYRYTDRFFSIGAMICFTAMIVKNVISLGLATVVGTLLLIVLSEALGMSPSQRNFQIGVNLAFIGCICFIYVFGVCCMGWYWSAMNFMHTFPNEEDGESGKKRCNVREKKPEDKLSPHTFHEDEEMENQEITSDDKSTEGSDNTDTSLESTDLSDALTDALTE